MGRNESIFTHILYKHYESPSFLNFEGGFDGQSAKPIRLDKPNRVEEVYADMMEEIGARTDLYNLTCSKNIMIILGSDFAWKDAGYDYENLDKLIKLMRSKSEFAKDYNIKYSTPNEYYDAIKHCSFPTSKNETYDPDMFPYSDNK